MFTFDPLSQAIQEAIGVNTATSAGTAVTPNATANTMGSWVSLGTTTFAYEQIGVMVGGATATSAGTYACDIGIYDGTTYNVILSNWCLPSGGTATGQPVMLPIHVPAGAQLGARVQCSTATGVATYLAVIGTNAPHGGAPGYSRCFNLAGLFVSNGVSITSSASANTKAASDIVVSSLERAEAVMLAYRPQTATRGYVFDFSTGSGGSASSPILSNVLAANLNTALFQYTPIIRRAIPAGTRLRLNLQASTGSSSLSVMPYGFA